MIMNENKTFKSNDLISKCLYMAYEGGHKDLDLNY